MIFNYGNAIDFARMCSKGQCFKCDIEGKYEDKKECMRYALGVTASRLADCQEERDNLIKTLENVKELYKK